MDSPETINITKRIRSSSSSSSNNENVIELSRISSESDSSSDDDDESVPSTSSQTPQYSLLRTKQGVLLQHRIKITTNSREEIRKTGFKMDEDFFSFTSEEDQIIRDNWKIYARLQKFNGTIFEFLGFDKDALNVKTISNIVPLNEFKIHLWPRLCRGLNNRFASLVRIRISYIFQPYYKENEDDYELKEAMRRVNAGESISEVCESLEIPPRFVEQHLANSRNKTSNKNPYERLINQKMLILNLLYKSILKDTEDNKFLMKNFDWELFREKCRDNSIDPPPNPTLVFNTFRGQFFKADNEIFKYLKPAPTLNNKMIYVHETFVRYIKKTTFRKRRSEKPFMNLHDLFIVVFEDYNKNEEWIPPPELKQYASKLDLEKIRERVENVRETRKKLSDTPIPKYNVVVKKKTRLEGIVNSIKSKRIKLEPIASMQNESPIRSPSQSISRASQNPEEELTEFEISTIDNSIASNISSYLLRNETILAAGGAGIKTESGQNDTSLGSINDQSTRKKADESVQLDLSQDIWSQLVGI